MKHHLHNFNRKFDPISEKLFIVLVLGFVSSILASFPIWFTFSRELPIVSIFTIFDNTSAWLHGVISSSLLLLLASSVLFQNVRNKIIGLFLIILCLSLSMDMLRIQPWVYYYSIMLFSFLLYPKSKESHLLHSFRIILILIYIWSGIQKLNFTFFSTTFSSLIQPILNDPSPETLSLITKISVIAPLTEIVFGIGLGFKRTRNLSVIILVCMHVFILSMIGPFGDNINAAVWPWNITFVAFLIILFWNKETILIKDIFQNRSIYHALIIILLGIMPVLSFWNMWPKYFSGALYSGNKIKSELYFSDQFKNDFSQELQNLIDNDKNRTSINNWTLSEANVATYPSEKYLLKFFENLCDSSQSEFDIIMILKSEPNIISGKRKESSYFCDELKGRHE